MNEIERMQKYLQLIRRAVGWSAEEFGERIGVTRQTINNIEGIFAFFQSRSFCHLL